MTYLAVGVIHTKNVWGTPGGLEAARSDLWALDLRQVHTNVKATFGFTPLPDPQTTYFYARSVTLPEQGTTEEVYLKGNIPVTLPGPDMPLGAVKVEFFLDTAAASINGPNIALSPSQAQSALYMLLYGWRQLARTGRGQFSLDPVPLLPLSTNPSAPLRLYKCDLDLYLLRGVTYDTITNPSAGPSDLEVAAHWRLVKCWISRLQIGELTSGAATPLTVTATIWPEDLLPDIFGVDTSQSQLPVEVGLF